MTPADAWDLRELRQEQLRPWRAQEVALAGQAYHLVNGEEEDWKQCSGCLEWAETETYYARREGGRRGKCNPCEAEEMRWVVVGLLGEDRHSSYRRTTTASNQRRRALKYGVGHEHDAPTTLEMAEEQAWKCGLAITEGCQDADGLMDPAVSHRHDRQATTEHLVELVAGGTHSRSNIVAACWECNRTKEYRRKTTR